MNIEIHLIGFGDDRPPCFDDSNYFNLQIGQPVTPRQLLKKAGFPDASGFIFMYGKTVVAENRWDESLIAEEGRVTLMSAIEGG